MPKKRKTKSAKKEKTQPLKLRCTLHKNILRCVMDSPKKYTMKTRKTIKRDFMRYTTACSRTHKGRCTDADRKITELIVNLPADAKLKG